MGTEALVALIVGILGLITRTYLERKDIKDESIQTHNQTFREDLAKSDVPSIHAELADLHDRVRKEVCGSSGK